jgi:hypothetical protein
LDRRRRVARATQKGATAIITSYLDSGLLLIFHPQQVVDTQFTAIGVNRLQKRLGKFDFLTAQSYNCAENNFWVSFRIAAAAQNNWGIKC